MTISGEWFNQNARPLLRSENQVSQDVATCDLADSAVTAAKIAAGIVSSEKATANLRHHTITFTVEKPSSSEAAGVAAVDSTAVVLWRPRTNVNILQVTGVTRQLYENATCDMFVLFGNAGTSIGQVSLKAVAGSTALAPGTRTAGSAINQAALAAGTDVLLRHVTSTCSTPRPYLLILDYESTG